VVAREVIFIGKSFVSFACLFPSLTERTVLPDLLHVRVKSHFRVKSQFTGIDDSLLDLDKTKHKAELRSRRQSLSFQLSNSGLHIFTCSFPFHLIFLPFTRLLGSNTTTPAPEKAPCIHLGFDIRSAHPLLLYVSKPRLKFPLPRRHEIVDNLLWYISSFRLWTENSARK
jgi:hypothetical protein